MEVSAVILSYNRRDALAKTLREVFAQRWAQRGEVIVVDNASTDGSADMVRAQFPAAKLIELPENRAIAGFNAGASAARAEFVLILDDDSYPQESAIEAALAHARSEPGCGGVMLHRRHPATGRAEWPFDQPGIIGVQHRWPDMGCVNLVRRQAWEKVGGYEEGFFLYRNDTDLALKLLGAGYDVVFNPAWQAWHDSIVATHKTDRWLYLSTRNWVWMSRRHGRRGVGLAASALGWLHAHRLAGTRASGHAAVLRGVWQGVRTAPPRLPDTVRPSGKDLWRLVRLKMRWR
jgi:N-acetylglucosaminyl-diphospho-decaprenol L-rhamnosyltransferase